MRFWTDELAAALGGERRGRDVRVDGVSTDSRTIVAGQLFVPLVDRTDGHAYLAAAVADGAPAYLTTGPTVEGATAIVVVDTAAALVAIGRAARDRLPELVVGITGSVGKTTVKELAAAALSTVYKTASSPMSFNNEIGVPLALANAPEDTEATVVELGARGPGHICALCEIARPTIGVVTRVGEAHTEFFGHIGNVAAAKGELVEALPASGTAVLNADDEHVVAMRTRTAARVLLYGNAPGADLAARDVVLDELARPSFTLVTPSGEVRVRLDVHGAHQVPNALAAAGAALAAGVGIDDIAEGLAEVGAPEWRMAVTVLAAGAVLVNDSYNANPTSVRAALEALAAMDGTRKVAVLGPMAELGAHAAAHHRSVAETGADLGIEVLAFASDAYGVAAFDDPDALVAHLCPLGPGDVVLVKGSRAAGMEEIASKLVSACGGGDAGPAQR